MGSSVSKIVDKEYWDRPIDEVLASSVAALRGVSDKDAEMLKDSIGVKTVKDLAENKFFRRAVAILAITRRPNHDLGPSLDWVDFFASAPDYTSKWPNKFRWEFGPIFFRGRLDGTARVLIIGQDPSTDEAIARRAFVGGSGQRLQGLLKKLGITHSYIMVNTFLYSIYGQFDSEMENISLDPLVINYRNEFLDKILNDNPIEAVIGIGAGARHAIQHWPHPNNLHISYLVHPAAPPTMVTDDWNTELPILLGKIEPDVGETPDPTPYGPDWSPNDRADIPRRDLPFGVPDWLGTGGTKSKRDGPKRIVWQA